MYEERSRGFGFLDAARQLISAEPGLTAQAIAARTLREGKATSYAKDPLGSLVATLHKQHRDIRVVRRKEGGSYRFYPGGGNQNGLQPTNNHRTEVSVADEVRVSVNVPRNLIGLIDIAVKSGKYAGREEALQALIEKGLASQI